MTCSRSVMVSCRRAAQSRASTTDSPDTCATFSPSTVTARTSGLRRRPAQVGHGFWTMNFSSSARMNSDSVSLKRRSRLVITPSKVAVYEFSPRSCL